MKKLICSVIIVLMTCTIVSGKERVKCTGELANGATKDGFGRIILVCEDDVIINKDNPLKMYAKEGMIVFDQTDVISPGCAEKLDSVKISPAKFKIVRIDS